MALAMSNYLSIICSAVVLHMVENKCNETELFHLSTDFFRKMELGEKGLIVTDLGCFSESI